MPAFLIADVKITDPALYDRYKAGVPASLEPYGGRFKVRGNPAIVAEGDWQPARLVMLEFPDMKSLKAWYGGPEYQAIIKDRLDGAITNMIFVEGV